MRTLQRYKTRICRLAARSTHPILTNVNSINAYIQRHSYGYCFN
ncbi:hypothetical protein ALT785_420046 [Alteromonas infernus]